MENILEGLCDVTEGFSIERIGEQEESGFIGTISDVIVEWRLIDIEIFP